MIHIHDDDSVRFAVWVGPGRDPRVAYLDGRQLAVTTSELGATGHILYATGESYNALGGRRHGEIDEPVLHRITHTVTGRDGRALFELETPCNAAVSAGACAVASREPRPGMEAEPTGSLVLASDHAISLIAWTDPHRAGTLRRAVYLDGRYLLEAGLGQDGGVRAWPASGSIATHGPLVAPSAADLAAIELRIASAAGSVATTGHD